MRASRRGSALVTVLLVSALLVVVCFSLASTAMLNLNFADAYANRTQSLLVAQAAVTQLACELDEAQDKLVNGAVDGDRDARPDLESRYRDNPVFPVGADRFPGSTAITFDARKDYYSVDNQYSDSPAHGWADRGGSGRSVPPFCLDVIVSVTMGGQTQRFEALLRRRWPYALTTPGKVILFGTPTFERDGATTTINPSRVAGRVYHLPQISFSMPHPTDVPAPSDDGASVFVDDALIHDLLGVFPREQGTVTVGGVAEFRPSNPLPGVSPTPVFIESKGNELFGNVDLSTEDPESVVYTHAPDNYWFGVQRDSVKPPNLVRNLQRAFQIPPVMGDWTILQPPHPELYAPPPEAPADPPPTDDGTPPDDGGDPPPDDETVPGDADHPPTDASPAPAASGSPSAPPVTPTPEPSPFYALYEDDLVLNGPPPRDGEAFDYPPEARYRIDMGCGNRYVRDGKVAMTSGYGLEMHNCVLHIAGNLDLSSRVTATGRTAQVPALRGTNATLIVDGTLIVNNGALEASQAGMVIYCRRLVTAAKGEYRGLIMVQKSAAICPSTGGGMLKIRGGIVCGGDGIHLYSNEGGAAAGGVSLQGLHLWSTDLAYDAKYLRTLHRFGPLELLSLRWFE